MNRHEEVGARVRAARKALGLTQAQVAQRAHLSESRYRQIETGWQQKKAGEKVPAVTTWQTLAQIANAVGIEPDELHQLAGVKPTPPPVIPPLPPAVSMGGADFSARERELLNMFFDWARDEGRREAKSHAHA